jgi:hypothetical protein
VFNRASTGDDGARGALPMEFDCPGVARGSFLVSCPGDCMWNFVTIEPNCGSGKVSSAGGVSSCRTSASCREQYGRTSRRSNDHWTHSGYAHLYIRKVGEALLLLWYGSSRFQSILAVWCRSVAPQRVFGAARMLCIARKLHICVRVYAIISLCPCSPISSANMSAPSVQ